MSASATRKQPEKTAAAADDTVSAPPAAKAPRRKAKPGSSKKPPAAAPGAEISPEVVAASAPAVTAEFVAEPSPAPAITAEDTAAARAAKEGKHKKPAARKTKLVRDSFSFPETDYALFAALKQRALSAGLEIKKSELVRAGLSLLGGLSEDELVQALRGVDRIKTGRPKK